MEDRLVTIGFGLAISIIGALLKIFHNQYLSDIERFKEQIEKLQAEQTKLKNEQVRLQTIAENTMAFTEMKINNIEKLIEIRLDTMIERIEMLHKKTE